MEGIEIDMIENWICFLQCYCRYLRRFLRNWLFQHTKRWILQLSFTESLHPSITLIWGKICRCPYTILVCIGLLWEKKLSHKIMLRRIFFESAWWGLGFMCTHIFYDLLFHLEGTRIPKEASKNIESLFAKHDEIQGNILENDLIALEPSSFESIQ